MAFSIGTCLLITELWHSWDAVQPIQNERAAGDDPSIGRTF